MMPPGGSAARGEALAEMSVLQHQILTDKQSARNDAPLPAGYPAAGIAGGSEIPGRQQV
jgi:hypothetical protein